MHVLVTASARFARTDDGHLWTSNASLGYPFWARYLDVFDDVRLLVRAYPLAAAPQGWNMATGPHIRALPLPNFVGITGFVKYYPRVKRTIAAALSTAEAVQLRVPCDIGTEVWRSSAGRRPYGVEVVGDPYDSFAPGSVRHPLRPFFRWWFPRTLRQICAGACAAAYVTEHALQQRYPCPAYMVGIADVHLPDVAFVTGPRVLRRQTGPVRLITVGTLTQLYKAHDVLIDALAACVQEGVDLILVLVGDGRYRTELAARAAARGLGDRVCFAGQLTSSDAVRAELDQSDVFILPSRTEGMPKALIEAMARALPCIASQVGGTPELLPPEDLVPPGDVAALAAKIHEVVTDPARMAAMSARNLAKAQEYHADRLRTRHIAFYQQARARTAAWLQTCS